jgi:hypothetical protein
MSRYVTSGWLPSACLHTAAWPLAGMLAQDRSLPLLSRCFGLAILLSAALLASQRAIAADGVTVGGLTFVSKGLVGVGRLPADLRDKFGETFGSGSGLAADPKAWSRAADGYHGTLYMLPDRGYNISGTLDYHSRLNKLTFVLRPPVDPGAMPVEARQHTFYLTLADSMLLTDAAGVQLTGLDPRVDGIRPATGSFPAMPQATTGAVSLDAEAIALLDDGTFFIGDEYGPYIYRFSATGHMLSAIRPPEAFIPKRNGKDSFSSNNPGPGAPPVQPPDPETGRQNNQGFEGVSLTPDSKYLVAVLQSATRQDGGTSAETRQNTRMLVYDIADRNHPELTHEYVVPLPVFTNAEGKRRVAAQSELLALDDTHFLLLCRDSGQGYGLDGSTSVYRKIEIVDISKATDIAGSQYDGTIPVAPNGKLADGIVPATLTTFIDIDDNAQLNKFGLHNGEPNDRNDLYEKWEGMALVPALDAANPRDFFLFVSNDNDFITQNGYQAGAAYKDPSGADVDTMILVYRVALPKMSNE